VRLALLGGTGRTGRLIIDHALTAGHSLTVLARYPDRLHLKHGNLTAVRGDASDPAVYAELLEGTDAVLSALGPVKGGSSAIMTLAAQQLRLCMEARGPRRLVSLTGAGVHVPGDEPTPLDRLIRTLLRLTQPAVLADATRHTQMIRASLLDWTVVRVPRLQDGPAKPVIAGKVGTVRPFITWASVAQFMIDAARDGTFLREAPAISN